MGRALASATPDAWPRVCAENVARLVLISSRSRDELGPEFGGVFKGWSATLRYAIDTALALPPTARTPEAIDGILETIRAPLQLSTDEVLCALDKAEVLAFDFEDALEVAEEDFEAWYAALAGELAKSTDHARKWLADWMRDRLTGLGQAITNAANALKDVATGLFGPICDHVPGAEELRETGELAKRLLQSLDGAFEAALRLPMRALEAREQEIARLIDALRRSFPDRAKALDDLGGRGLRVLRAFGDAPIVPGLDFGRGALAYFFHQGKGPSLNILDGVHFTPVTALLGKAANELSALRVRWPTGGFLEGLTPDLRALGGALLRDAFPDFAGFRLDQLFSGLGFPQGDADRVKIRQGVDAATKQAWVEADIAVQTPVAD